MRRLWIGAGAAVLLAGGAGTGAWLAAAHADAPPTYRTPEGAGLRLALAPPPPPPRMPPPTGEKLAVLSVSAEPPPVDAGLLAAENASLLRRMEGEEARRDAALTADLRRQDRALERELRALEAAPSAPAADLPVED